MLTIDEIITESFSCKDAGFVLDICQDIVLSHNYRLTSVGEDHVRFKSFGEKPVSKNEGILYIDKGTFITVSTPGGITLDLNYTISYALDLVAIGISIAMILYAGAFGFLLLFAFGGQLFYRIKKIRKGAEAIMADIRYYVNIEDLRNSNANLMSF